MNPIITGILTLAHDVMAKINADAARKWLDARTKVMLQINEEEGKGDAANDALIENLYAQLPIIDEAAKNEIALASVTKP